VGTPGGVWDGVKLPFQSGEGVRERVPAAGPVGCRGPYGAAGGILTATGRKIRSVMDMMGAEEPEGMAWPVAGKACCIGEGGI